MSTAMTEMNARVAQLQSMLGMRAAGVLGGGAGSSTSATSASPSAFADALSEALGTGGASGTTGADALATGRQAVALARTYSGVPYLWGGTDPAKGLDCSGLVQLVYDKLGVTLPRVAEDQAKAGVAVPSLDAARPGDLVFFGSPAHHVGLYVGDGQMIDAPRAGRTVGVHAVAGYGAVSGIRRVGGAALSAASTAGAANRTAALLGGSSTALLSATGLAVLGATGIGTTGIGTTGIGTTGAGTTGAGATGIGTTGAGTTAAGGLTGPYAALFAAAGARYGVDPALLSAVARTESSYDASAVSRAGARGLMQLMPGTARSLRVDPDDPAQAVDGAARLLAGLLRQFGGRTDLALAGYNAGPGAVQKYGGVPPFAETRTYVRRVTSAWEALR